MSDISVTNPTVVDEDIEILTRAGYRKEAPAGYTIGQRSLAEFVGTFALASPSCTTAPSFAHVAADGQLRQRRTHDFGPAPMLARGPGVSGRVPRK